LALKRASPKFASVIAFLRFVGLINASVWLGAVVFFSITVSPAVVSPDMAQLLGAKNFPFFSGAVTHILTAHYFIFLGATAIVALLHLLAEWLYMGRPTRKFSMMLVGALLALVLIGGLWVEPHLEKLHDRRYAPNVQPVERETAARSYRLWHIGLLALDMSMIAGLVVYVWRVAHPSDAPRFISSVKFRG